MDREILVRSEHLVREFAVPGGRVKAVSDISLSLYRRETLALVGESGCGKSTLGRLLLRLIEPSSGKIFFDGEDLTAMNKTRLRQMRKRMQLVFQDPYAALDPRMKVRNLIAEPLRAFGCSREERDQTVSRVAQQVGLREDQLELYPHEFSGGQRQRICIARAIALQPEFIVCDEPVSALDVSIQAQVLNLLQELQKAAGLTYLFISHDLSVVHHISDRVCVMYLGQVCEIGTTEEIFFHPRHPYTRFLLEATPSLDPDQNEEREEYVLSTDLPSPINPPSGCRFHTRCPHAKEICARQVPACEGDDNHSCACHFPL